MTRMSRADPFESGRYAQAVALRALRMLRVDYELMLLEAEQRLEEVAATENPSGRGLELKAHYTQLCDVLRADLVFFQIRVLQVQAHTAPTSAREESAGLRERGHG